MSERCGEGCDGYERGFAAALEAVLARAENERRYGLYGSNMIRDAVKVVRRQREAETE